jgi:2-polyprenyl-3-methyl-5-hydroxy-6-metoxy-1,4-benzoquinol methylase
MQGHDVMPWWLNYLLVNPIRRLFDSPKKTLQPVVAKGMTIIEPGCGMGYFSLPMARMIGSRGKLYCLDLGCAYHQPTHQTGGAGGAA